MNLRKLPFYVLLAVVCAVPLLTLAGRNERGRWEMNRCAMAAPDEPSYLLMARSIAEEGTISTTDLAGRDTFYPPGLPVLLATWGKVFGFSIQSLHVCVALTSSLAGIMCFLLARLVLNRWGWSLAGLLPWKTGTADWGALAITALFVTSWHFLDLTLFVFSEPLFILLSFAWIFAALRLPGWQSRPHTALLVTGLALGAAMARAAGIVCLVTTLVYMMMSTLRAAMNPTATRGEAGRRLTALLAGLVLIVLVFAAIHRVSPEKSPLAGMSTDNSYTKQLLVRLKVESTPWYRIDLFSRRIVALAVEHLPNWFHSFMPPYRWEDEPWRKWPFIGVAAPVMALCLLGLGRRCLWPGPTGILELYLLGYTTLYLVWPFYMIRFWVPILPLLLLYMLDLLAVSITPRSVAWSEVARRYRGGTKVWRPHARTQTPLLELSCLMVSLLISLNIEEIITKLPYYQRRLNYVSDCLAQSARVIRDRAPDPRKAIVLVPGADEQYLMAWYLQAPNPTQHYVAHAPARDVHLETLLADAVAQAKSDPAKRVFVMGYFGTIDDVKQAAGKLQQGPTAVLARSNPAQLRGPLEAPPAPGQWKITKLDQRSNVTAVWEITPAAPLTAPRTGS